MENALKKSTVMNESNYYGKYFLRYISLEKGIKEDSNHMRIVNTDVAKMNLYDISQRITFDDVPCTHINVSVNDDNISINIENGPNTKTEIIDGKRYYWPAGAFKSYNVFAFSKEVFVRTRGKVRPITLKDIFFIANMCPEAKTIMEILIRANMKEYPFFKDFYKIYEDSVKRRCALLPFTFNDLFKYHTWDDYFKGKYRDARKLNVNFNTMNPICSYQFIKTIKHISERDYYILLDAMRKYHMIVDTDDFLWDSSDMVQRLILDYYRFVKGINDFREQGILIDWINMSIKLKHKISLRKSSIRKIIDAHDDLAREEWENDCKRENDYSIIKKKSRFSPLRDILPESFEWIQTHNRLYEESAMQHHCVWSYEDRVKSDTCTIYSYVVPETGIRHTLEFRRDENEFYLMQIQKKYDRGYDKVVLDVLNDIIGQNSSEYKLSVGTYQRLALNG